MRLVRLLFVCALAAGCVTAGEEGGVSVTREALSAAPSGASLMNGLPSCAGMNLGDVDATAEDQGGGLVIVEVEGEAVCVGTEEEVSDALGREEDPDDGTPLPAAQGEKSNDPDLPGTPLPAMTGY